MSEDLVASVGALVQQLSSSAQAPSRLELESIVASPATRLLIACDGDGAVLGTLTLALFRIPTGMRAWIEDVVVDDAARGRGVAQILMRAAVRLAQDAGAQTVDLTSRPSRVAANRLYRKIGFVQRETNVYRFTASSE
ncbi:MAG: GNAT family N-acetyltransferase [Actinobacteria bacterium]|nr:GNAT family N-acetyltransferase [Actinomycetota bacterium]